MRLKKLLFSLLGIPLFVYLISIVGVDTIVPVLYNIDLGLLALALAITPITLLLKGFKWQYIMKLHGFNYPLLSATRVWTVGMFLGIITPARVGDFMKVFYLKKVEKSTGKCLSSIVIDRFLDLITSLLFAGLGLLWVSWFFETADYLVFLGLLVLSFFAIVFISTKKDLARFVFGPIYRLFVPDKYKKTMKEGFNEFYKSINDLLRMKRELLFSLVFSVAIWLLSIFQLQLLAFAMGIKLAYFYVLIFMSIAVLVELLPISIMGLGTREATLIFLFSLVGLGESQAIAFSIAHLVYAYLLVATIGFVFWLKEPPEIKL